MTPAFEAAVEQAHRDLDELEVQVAAGEIDPDTAAGLRATYRQDLVAAEAAMAEARSHPPSPPRRGRLLVGGLILVGSLAVVVALASQAIEPRPLSAVPEDFDPSSYSNETLEAVIAANTGHPMINGMRIALANRYFEERTYRLALPHYQAVLEGEATADQQAEALARTGWMVFDGNGEVDLATDLIDRALAVRPDFALATYFKAQVRWCGAAANEEAVGLFDVVLASPDLPAEVRSQVEADRHAAAAGDPCR